MNSSVQRLRRLAAAIAGAALLALGVTGAGADVNPNGGSDFEPDADGWEATTAQCSFGEGSGGGFCGAEGARVPDGGNPGGALRARTSILVNTGGLFTADYVFRSASFSPKDPFDAVFTYDRRFEPGQLTAIGARADVTAVLVNEATGAERMLLEDPLTQEDTQYENRLVGIPAGVIRQDTSYHLELRVAVGSNSSQEELLGTSDVFFDNVRLISSERQSGAGGPDGVAPGGSVTLLRKCTIFGTEGDDRIEGTPRTDSVCALGGDDVVTTKGSPDVVDGANGNDVARGGKKADLLLGLKGRDRLIGTKGADRLLGGKDRDVLKAGADNDNISARDGERDVVDGGPGKRNRARIDGKDKVRRIQRVMGQK